MNSNTIETLLKNNFIFCSEDTYSRINSERYSLLKIENKSDFLNRYNTVIRYLYLSFLSHGFDIDNNKVHIALQDYCVCEHFWPRWKIKQIVSARHTLKYYKRMPQKEIFKNLKILLELLENKN